MNELSHIRVGIVEDDPDWLRGLVDYITSSNGMEVVWKASSAHELQEVLQEAVDVVLMDIMLDGQPEGIRLAEQVCVATGARIIMLTSMEEKEFIFRSFQAGAIDYQIKSNFEQLPDAIRQAYCRQSPISAAAAEQMREEFRRLKQVELAFEKKKMADLITPSELQLLQLIDQGYTQPQIADKQFISLRTVKNHINHILKKLGMPGSKEAASKVKEMGLMNNENSSNGTN